MRGGIPGIVDPVRSSNRQAVRSEGSSLTAEFGGEPRPLPEAHVIRIIKTPAAGQHTGNAIEGWNHISTFPESLTSG